VSKGSKRRPRQIKEQTFKDNWDKIFGSKKKKESINKLKRSCADSLHPIYLNLRVASLLGWLKNRQLVFSFGSAMGSCREENVGLKWLCNGKNVNCTALAESPIPMGFLSMCGCAIAHACTYAQRGLKALCLEVCAVVQLCNPLKRGKEVGNKPTFHCSRIDEKGILK
tara:strand:+ start:778 stop:1281 length:504 start_codon:yes stop_codon:yes gene_type:complete